MDRIRSGEYFRETEHVRYLGNKASLRWFGRGGRMENMAGGKPAGGAGRRFMDVVVKENMKLVGVREKRTQRME